MILVFNYVYNKFLIFGKNQFFITTTNPIKDDVKNTVGLALVERITRAHK